MEAFELHKEGGLPTGIFACGKCRIVFGGIYWPNPQQAAEDCCKPKLCPDCGQEIPKHSYCRPCQVIKEAQKLQAQFEAAEKLTVWDGVTYSPHFDMFFEPGELEDWLDDFDDEEEGERPTWVFTCREKAPPKLLASDLVETLAEEMFEDAGDHFAGVEELQKALDIFWEVNKDVVTYIPNYNQVLLLGKGGH